MNREANGKSTLVDFCRFCRTVLAVHRDQKTFDVLREDRCFLCAQGFLYLDQPTSRGDEDVLGDLDQPTSRGKGRSGRGGKDGTREDETRGDVFHEPD